MRVSREEIDRAIDEHFRFEATDDVDGVIASLDDEVEHEVIPSPAGMLRDRAELRAFYVGLFENLRGESVTTIRRLYGDDFAVDESLWKGYMADGGPFLCEGRSGPVSFRLLHVFEFRNGRISRESVWCDVAAIQRQLGAAQP